MSDDDLVRLVCPQCQQPIAFARDNPADEIGCPKCDVGIQLERLADGGIGSVEAFAPESSSPATAVPQTGRFRLQRKHAGLLFTFVVFLGIYFVGIPHLKFRWALKKAKQGDVAAQMDVALRYEAFGGTWRNFEEAIYWYAEAAGNGDLHAMFLIHGAMAPKKELTSNYITIHDGYGKEALAVFALSLGKDKATKVPKFFTDAYQPDPLGQSVLQDYADRSSAIALVQLARDNPFSFRFQPSEYTERIASGPLMDFFRNFGNETPFEPGSKAEIAARNIHRAFRNAVREDSE